MDKRRTIFPGSDTRYPVRASASLVPVHGQPWDTYKPVWTIGSTKKVTVAYLNSKPATLFTIKALSLDSEHQLFAVSQGALRHPNLVSVHAIFASEISIFVVFPYYAATLEAINTCPQFPSDEQLAVITREVRLQVPAI